MLFVTGHTWFQPKRVFETQFIVVELLLASILAVAAFSLLESVQSLRRNSGRHSHSNESARARGRSLAVIVSAGSASWFLAWLVGKTLPVSPSGIAWFGQAWGAAFVTAWLVLCTLVLRVSCGVQHQAVHDST
jgi:hypothetical protein